MQKTYRVYRFFKLLPDDTLVVTGSMIGSSPEFWKEAEEAGYTLESEITLQEKENSDAAG